jgi:hypothetical protein
VGNKVAPRDEGPGDGGSISLPSSSVRGGDYGGPLGLHRIDTRAMKKLLDLTLVVNETLKKNQL